MNSPTGRGKVVHKLFTAAMPPQRQSVIYNIIQYMSYKICWCWCRWIMEIHFRPIFVQFEHLARKVVFPRSPARTRYVARLLPENRVLVRHRHLSATCVRRCCASHTSFPPFVPPTPESAVPLAPPQCPHAAAPLAPPTRGSNARAIGRDHSAKTDAGSRTMISIIGLPPRPITAPWVRAYAAGLGSRLLAHRSSPTTSTRKRQKGLLVRRPRGIGPSWCAERNGLRWSGNHRALSKSRRRRVRAKSSAAPACGG